MGGTRWKPPFPYAIGLAVVLSVVTSVIVHRWPLPFNYIDWRFYDYKLGWKPPGKLHSDIVHVDIDDKTVNNPDFGRWPWNRSVSARVVNRLCELGVRTIVFDIFYAYVGKKKEDIEGDEAFAEAVRKADRVISAASVTIGPRTGDTQHEEKPKQQALYDNKTWEVQIPPNFKLLHVKKLSDKGLPYVALLKNSQYVGNITAQRDEDGVHRRLPLLVTINGRSLPSLSLAALVGNLKIPIEEITPETVTLQETGELWIKHPGGIVKIPVDSDGTMLISWNRLEKEKEKHYPESFRKISLAGIFDDDSTTVRRNLLKDKIAIVGVTYTGHGDIGVNPFIPTCVMSRLHSNALNTMLTGDFVKTIHSFPYVILITLVLAWLFTAPSVLLRHDFAVLLLVGVAAGYIGTVVLLFIYGGYEVPTAGPLFVFVTSITGCLAARAVSVESKGKRVAGALQRYLSPQMLEAIVDQDEGFDLATKRKELTILFADIKGFSTMSETVDVEYLERFLNDYFEAMTTAIFDHGGTVDKFLGDGLLAFFGDPVEMDNHALAAIKTAQQMHSSMIKLNKKWTTAGIKEFENGITMRIGVNTGVVMVGNVGSRRRMEYTCVGSAVNVASRMEKAAPPGGILISARTFVVAGNSVKCDEGRTIRVRGVEREITVFEVQSIEAAA